MSYKVKGKIVSISNNQEFDSGAKKLNYRIDTGEDYNNLLEFEMFKGAEYVDHLDKFREFNKVGDLVEVEFKLKSNHWTKNDNDKVFIGLTSWRVEKVQQEGTPITQGLEQEDSSGLPF